MRRAVLVDEADLRRQRDVAVLEQGRVHVGRPVPGDAGGRRVGEVARAPVVPARALVVDALDVQPGARREGERLGAGEHVVWRRRQQRPDGLRIHGHAAPGGGDPNLVGRLELDLVFAVGHARAVVAGAVPLDRDVVDDVVVEERPHRVAVRVAHAHDDLSLVVEEHARGGGDVLDPVAVRAERRIPRQRTEAHGVVDSDRDLGDVLVVLAEGVPPLDAGLHAVGAVGHLARVDAEL